MFAGFDVAAKFLPHGRKHFLGEGVLLECLDNPAVEQVNILQFPAHDPHQIKAG